MVWGDGKHPSPIQSEKVSASLGMEEPQEVGCCFWSSICRVWAWGRLQAGAVDLLLWQHTWNELRGLSPDPGWHGGIFAVSQEWSCNHRGRVRPSSQREEGAGCLAGPGAELCRSPGWV